jgi:hypothetical protein
MYIICSADNLLIVDERFFCRLLLEFILKSGHSKKGKSLFLLPQKEIPA